MPSVLDPPPRALLRDQVYERLLQAVVDGTLEPGERLAEPALVAWLETSRTPIRSALDRLVVLGLVEVSPQRGTRVTHVDLDEVADCLEAAGALLRAVVGEAVRRLDTDARALLEYWRDVVLTDPGTHASAITNVVSHETLLGRLAELGGNPVLHDALLRLGPALRRFVAQFPDAVDLAALAQVQRTVVDAALAGDVPATSAAVDAIVSDVMARAVARAREAG